MISKLFRGRNAPRPVAEAHATEEIGREAVRTQESWKRLLVPAVDAGYSMRSLEVAFRLAQGTDATVQLAFVIEVPRALPLEAALPEPEMLAAITLRDGQEAARAYKVPVEAFVHRTRSAPDGILKLIAQEKTDLLILGGRPDAIRGLPAELLRELFRRAPCEVVLDYIADEK
jgi:nucleotide-binding universal stress UspA family protein